jgi:hypothetical protein
MINGRRTKNNRGIVHKNAIDNVNGDLEADVALLPRKPEIEISGSI